jgi:hypothetical protein
MTILVSSIVFSGSESSRGFPTMLIVCVNEL